jgi:hypothetical protein
MIGRDTPAAGVPSVSRRRGRRRWLRRWAVTACMGSGGLARRRSTMMRIMISVALLFVLIAGTTKANAVCVFGFGSDCPLSNTEAINQIKPRLERQQLRFGQVTQNIVQVPGVGHTVYFEYSDGSNEARLRIRLALRPGPQRRNQRAKFHRAFTGAPCSRKLRRGNPTTR